MALTTIGLIDEVRRNRSLAPRATHSIEFQSVLLSGSKYEVSEAMRGTDDMLRVARENHRRVLRVSGHVVPVVDNAGGRRSFRSSDGGKEVGT